MAKYVDLHSRAAIRCSSSARRNTSFFILATRYVVLQRYTEIRYYSARPNMLSPLRVIDFFVKLKMSCTRKRARNQRSILYVIDQQHWDLRESVLVIIRTTLRGIGYFFNIDRFLRTSVRIFIRFTLRGIVFFKYRPSTTRKSADIYAIYAERDWLLFKI